MTEQPTTPPPAGRTPTLGRGWSAHPDLDGPIPPAEPWKPPADRARPATGWSTNVTVGASTQLTADEHPVTVPARPYADGGWIRADEALAEVDEEPTWVVYLFGRAIGWFRR